MQNIDDLIQNATNGIRTALETAEIVGKPIVNGDGTIILPVSKVSVGFVVGGIDEKKVSNFEINTKKSNTAPLGASGGGVSVTPLGFLICGREKKFVSVDDSGQNKWATLFGDIVECFKKDEK